MGPFLLLNAALVGFFLFASLYHFFLWAASRRETILPIFGMDCALRAAFSIVVMAIATAQSVEIAQRELHLRIALGILMTTTWLWTLTILAGIRDRRMVVAMTVFLLSLFPIHMFLFSLESKVLSVQQFVLPWGETISNPMTEPPGWWFGPLYLLVTSIDVFGIRCGSRIWKRDRVAGGLIFLTVGLLLFFHAGFVLRAYGIIDFPFVGVIGHVIWAGVVGLVITRRNHQMREELAASERRFRGIFDQTFQYVWLLKTDGTLVEANQSAIEISGGLENDEADKPLDGMDWCSHSPELQERLRSAVQTAAAGIMVSFEATLRCSDGSRAYLDFSLKPLRDKKSKIAQLLAEGRDVTFRKRSEDVLKQRVAELTILNRVGVICAKATTTDELLRQTTEVIAELGFPKNYGFVLIDQNRQVQVTHPSFVFSDPAADRDDQPFGFGTVGQVAQTDLVQNVTDATGEEDHSAAQAGAHSQLCVPLQIGSEVVGVLNVECQEPNGFTPEDQQLLGTIAGVVGNALDRIRAHETLLESEARFRLVFEGASDAIFWADAETGLLTHCNLSAEELVGRTREELIGQPQSILHPPDQAELYRELFARHAANHEKSPLEVEVYRPDRRKVFVSIAPSVTIINGRKVVQGIFRDITLRKQTEESLRASEQRFSLFMQHLPGLAWIKDSQGRYVYANDNATRVFCKSREDLYGKTDDQVFPHETALQFKNADQTALATGCGLEVVESLVHSDGTMHHSIVNKFPLPDPNGNGMLIGGVAIDITERKKAESELQRSLSLLTATLESTADGILVVNSAGEIVSYNQRFLELWRIPKEIIDAREDDTVLAYVIDQLQDADAFLSKVRELYSQPEAVSFESLKFKDGRVYERYSQPQRLEGVIVGRVWNYRDVTERERTAESLQMMRFCVDHAGDAVFWVSRTGQILYVNDAACSDRGYSRDELLGMTIFELDPDYQPGIWEPHFEDLKKRRTINLETRHRKKDGDVFPIEVSANYVHVGNKEFNFAFARDITQRKKAEEERQDLEAQILHAQKLESLGVLAGGIAHDFNNLLTVVMGNAGLSLMLLNDDSPAWPMIREIELAAQRAADLTQQMLAYAGKGSFVIEPLRLDTLVGEMTNLLKTAISKKAILELSMQPSTINADATQIRQVIMNLIMNASDALDGGVGTIQVRVGARFFDAESLRSPYLPETLPAGNYAFIEVEDDGCGMTDETQKKIFDPFYTTKFAGRGLGLAAVLGIVRGHHGTIKTSSAPNRGTVFQVLFPCENLQCLVGTTSKNEEPLSSGHGTVLVVEDEQIIRKFIQSVLENAGFRVILAQDGQEGINAYRQNFQRIEIVLLDLTMPRMDGLQFIDELRGFASNTPVLIMSGYTEHEDSIRKLAPSVNGFIQKPFSPRNLTERVLEILSSHRTARIIE